MPRINLYTLLFFLLAIVTVLPQTVEFLPGTRLFTMLKAADSEPKFGLTFFPNDRSMKVDVGNAFDVISIKLDSTSTINAGTEFFAYAKVIEYRDYRLQVAAIDGYFGGNISWSKQIDGTPHFINSRLRFIHRSAHLVDGAWDPSNNSWKDAKGPVPFADDFFELNPGIQFKFPLFDLRLYCGVAYSILIRPEDQKRTNFSAGSEFFLNEPLFTIMNKPARLFAAYDLKMRGRPEFTPSHSLMTGIKFGQKEGIGVSLYAFYYSGYDWFSSYYKNHLTKFGLGFFIDFNP